MPQIDLESDLLNYLISAGFQPGDRLPTITELQTENHLGQSISKVREQLEVARALGLVEVRSKTGMKLKPYSFTPAVRLSLFFALATDPDAFELFTTLRNHIEVAFWHEACASMTDDDKAIMHQCVETAREKLTAPRIRLANEEHRTFHLTMFRHLENPFVIGLLEAYWDAYLTMEPNRYAEYAYHQSVWNYHEQILNAIDAGDYDTAQRLFVEHTRLLRYDHPDQAGV
jgi:DNA-binding FadR family transcriptional regulator